MNVNKAILVGRLTRDPELRTTSTGQTVASLSLATGHTWKDKAGVKQEKTEFHNIVLWGRLAEIAGQYLIKGQEAYFEGRLQTQKYTDKNGVERYKTEVVAENMQLGAKPRGAAPGSYPSSPTPAGAAASSAQETPAETIPTINLDEEDEVKVEDVPF
jgi:single-strand DNA-binding protein